MSGRLEGFCLNRVIFRRRYERIRKMDFFSKLSNRVSSKQRIIFTRQFATLIGAGLPLFDELEDGGGTDGR